ncbi:hypothetical protein [Lysinibacter cavernae]|uniref:Uncharacterized protein n=1 Tax=Lysinibacter cavernae TaxID=1640652 RepID=A0A7X5TSN6_9MICO|nr:hypothetical protein [Lysinibacter cavernae]NIH52629.1 hypothetical protein [Lysinibacter cavernae]
MINAADVPDDEAPLTPEQMLALSAQQSVNTELKSTAPVAGMYIVWGVAWAIGYLLHWSNTGGNPWFTVSTQTTIIGFTALMIAGSIYSIVSGMRIDRGVRGKGKFSGAIYGLSWAVLSTATALIGVALIQAGMNSDLAAIYFPCAFTFMVGSMYLFGAALWSSSHSLWLGLWLIAVAVVAAFIGKPQHYLLVAVAGGGMIIATGVAMILARKREQTEADRRFASAQGTADTP